MLGGVSGDEQPEQPKCQACQGYGTTEHVQYTTETDKDGTQIPVERHWTGPCDTCHGSGQG